MIVDVHAHAASEDFIRETAAKPSYGMPYEVRADGSYATRGYGEMDRLMWDLDGRLENLQRRGIGLQLISPSPRTISDHEHVIGVEIARLMNRKTANLVKRGGGRLGGMAVVPLGEPEKAADEIRWAVGEYGFSGSLPTHVGGGQAARPSRFRQRMGHAGGAGSPRLHACDDSDHTRATRPVHPQHGDRVADRGDDRSHAADLFRRDRAPPRAPIGVVPRRRNAPLSRGAPRPCLSRTQVSPQPP